MKNKPFPRAKTPVRKKVKKAFKSGKPSKIKKLSVAEIHGSGTRKQRKALADIKPTKKKSAVAARARKKKTRKA